MKKSEIFAKIRDFRENPRFSRKSKIFAKIRDFRENPRFLRKSKIFVKIRDCRENPRFSPNLQSTSPRPPFFSYRGGLGGRSPPQFQSFQKICPEGKFFEMVSWGGEAPPGISVTRALPPCLAPNLRVRFTLTIYKLVLHIGVAW